VNIWSFYAKLKVGQLSYLALREAPPVAVKTPGWRWSQKPLILLDAKFSIKTSSQKINRKRDANPWFSMSTGVESAAEDEERQREGMERPRRAILEGTR
jgi:hypothetical protein